jgi:hypothetical protein
MPSSLESMVVMTDSEEILGSLLSSMLFNLFLYIRYLVIVMLSMGERLVSMRRMG